MEDLKILLTPNEVAAALAIGRSKAYELISRGELASVRVDRSVRVPVSDILQWVEDHKTGGKASE